MSAVLLNIDYILVVNLTLTIHFQLMRSLGCRMTAKSISPNRTVASMRRGEYLTTVEDTSG